jgi:hypothetical protein
MLLKNQRLIVLLDISNRGGRDMRLLTFVIVIVGLGLVSPSVEAASPDAIRKAIIKLLGGGSDSVPNPVPPAGRSASRLGACPHANSSKIQMDKYIEVTASQLNFRKCAAESCSVLGSLKQGSYKVDVLSIKNCWLEVGVTSKNSNKVYGFLSGNYVKFR